MKCLIVGAGVAGLTAAGALQAHGWEVVLLDKGRGVGGRMATRRIGQSRLDHGVQFFTVRDADFRTSVDRWEQAGWVSPWFTENGHVRYRAANGMNALAKHLAAGLDVRTESKVERVEAIGEGWCVRTDSGLEFRTDALVLTAPAAQSMALLAGCADRLPEEMNAALKQVKFDPCFALLVTLDGKSCVPAPGFARPDDGPIEWIADNEQKGISPGFAALTIHASAEFSREYYEAPQDDVERLLLEAAEPWFGGRVLERQLHRWRYSRPVGNGGSLCLYSQTPAPISVAGDAFAGGRVEGAFLSGLAAAEKSVG